MARFPGLLHVFRATLQKVGLNVSRRLSPIGTSRMMAKASDMPPVLVRAVDGAERMQLSFEYTSPITGKERLYNFDRALDEHLDVTVARIAANVAKTLNKKKKRKKGQDEQPDLSVDVVLFHNDVAVDPEMPNKKVWCPGARLRIGDAEYTVVVNPPTVTSFNLPGSLMAGSIICPEVKLEFADLKSCRFTWYREKPTMAMTPNPDASDLGYLDELGDNVESTKKRKASTNGSPEWEEIHQGYMYEIKEEDVGHRLRVVCFPGSSDGVGTDEVAAVTETPVHTAPVSFPFQRRQECTQHKTPSNRCVSDYYILCFSAVQNLLFRISCH